MGILDELNEHFILRLTKMVKRMIDGEKFRKANLLFTKQEGLNFVQSNAGFLNTVGVEGNSVLLSDNDFLKAAFYRNKFFQDEYILNSPEYSRLVSNNKKLKELANGKRLELVNSELERRYTDGSCTVYEQFDDKVKVYNKIEPVKTSKPQIFRNANLLQLKQELVEEFHFYFEADGNKLKAYQDTEPIGYLEQIDNDVYFYSPNAIYNPFEEKLIRLFDANGEITNLNGLNLPKIMRAIRDTEAHKHMQQYYKSGRSYGARVCKLKRLNMTALVSNFWYSNIMDLANNQWKDGITELDVLYVPRGTRSVKNESDLDEKLAGIKLLNIKFRNEISNVAIKTEIDNICLRYSNMQVTNIKLADYIKKELSGYAKVEQITEKPVNTRLLKAKLLGDKGFYTIVGSEKENKKLQTDWIKYMVEDIYGLDFVNDNIINAAEKVSPVKVDLVGLRYIMDNLVANAQLLAGMDTEPSKMNYANDERFIALSAFCIYHNLIHNAFLDSVEGKSTLFRGYVATGLAGELQSQLMALDMSAFRIKNKTEDAPKTFNQRLSVLRSMRNAVAHNNFYIKYAKNGNIDELSFVFEFENFKATTVVVNTQKFLEFINNPLFVNFGDGFENESKANSAKELVDGIIAELKSGKPKTDFSVRQSEKE